MIGFIGVVVAEKTEQLMTKTAFQKRMDSETQREKC